MFPGCCDSWTFGEGQKHPLRSVEFRWTSWKNAPSTREKDSRCADTMNNKNNNPQYILHLFNVNIMELCFAFSTFPMAKDAIFYSRLGSENQYEGWSPTITWPSRLPRGLCLTAGKITSLGRQHRKNKKFDLISNLKDYAASRKSQPWLLTSNFFLSSTRNVFRFN